MENSKVGYIFNKETGEFLGTETVYLEKRTGEYPHSDNVLFIEPPKVKENQKQVWIGNKWKIVADFRRKKWYKKDGSEGGTIDFLGDLGDKIIEAPPEHDYAEYLDYDYANKKWDIKLHEGFVRDSATGFIRQKTQEELYDEGKITLEEYNEYIKRMREARFRSETDKMALMYLRGECTLEEWKAAMDKIREELPKKEK